ncbi:MAG: FCD domain-containing protein [Streptosporangiales bacterium]|nr:FCD domain-containing protein [Streptosporangiales bacterium]
MESRTEPDARRGTSLREAVHQGLRDAILHGRYRPNQRLVELELAEELNASRTPVREALQRLGSEGLIVRVRRGWAVREFSKSEIRQIYEVRLALEGYAARLAAERASDRELDEIGALIDEQLRAQAADVIPRDLLVQVNDRFHDCIVAASGNERLVESIRHSRTYYFNYRLAALYSDGQAVASLDEHVAIAAAVRRRAGDKAELLTREHITSAVELIVDRLI